MDATRRRVRSLLDRGTIVSGYRVEDVIGHGGMGVVYEATQISLNRTVALKLLAAHLSDDPMFRERFRREGLLQAQLDHPHIVTVHEAGESEYGLFLAMRMIRGPRLKDLIVTGELDAGRTLRLLRTIADALDFAHESGLIHRDVKPQNMLVGARDHAYLADFGLTKLPDSESLTGSGHFVGTIDYVAPEQIVGERASVRSDVYGLAATLAECLMGRPTYQRENDAAVLYAHLNEPPPRPSEIVPGLPREIDDVIERGMAKEPADRHRSAGELMTEARRALGTASSSIRPLPAPTGSGKRTRFASEIPTLRLARGRRWPLGLLAGVVATGAVAALIGVLTGGGTATNEGTRHQAGPIALNVPAGWRSAPQAPSLPGMKGPRTLVLTHQGDPAGDTLIAANLAHTGPELLPNAFVSLLPKVPSHPDPVRLGGAVAQRYRALEPRGLGRRVTVYVVPDSAGVATLACTATSASAASFLPRCEAVAGTLQLVGAEAQSLKPNGKYAKQLDAVVADLNRARTKGRAQLKAKRPAVQARAAGALASGFAAAARRMGKIKAPPAASRAHALVVAGSRRAARAYTRMRSAARKGKTARYRAAVRDARAAEAAVQRGFASLKPLGYSVR